MARGGCPAAQRVRRLPEGRRADRGRHERVQRTATWRGARALQPPAIHTGADPESVVLDSQTQTLYTANEVDNDISVIDASRCNAQTTSGCRHPAPAIADPGRERSPPTRPSHTTYVTTGSNTVSMINTQHLQRPPPAGCAATPPRSPSATYPTAVAVDPPDAHRLRRQRRLRQHRHRLGDQRRHLQRHRHGRLRHACHASRSPAGTRTTSRSTPRPAPSTSPPSPPRPQPDLGVQRRHLQRHHTPPGAARHQRVLKVGDSARRKLRPQPRRQPGDQHHLRHQRRH